MHRPTFSPQGGYLAFLGRISPEKRPDRAIAIAKPRGIQQLGRIKGVGSTKLEAWGTEVLDVVNR